MKIQKILFSLVAICGFFYNAIAGPTMPVNYPGRLTVVNEQQGILTCDRTVAEVCFTLYLPIPTPKGILPQNGTFHPPQMVEFFDNQNNLIMSKFVNTVSTSVLFENLNIDVYQFSLTP